MKKKIKISLILSLAIIFGCFSNVFAASNQNDKAKKMDEVKKSVRVLDNATTDDGGVIGTSNLNGTAENSAKLGDQLTSPEVGWKRYDDSDKKIKYNGNWGTVSNHNLYYNGTVSGTLEGGSTIVIKFYGTKYRIISSLWNGNSSNVKINVDGIDDTFNCNSSSLKYQILVYTNKTILKEGIHTITITSTDNKQLQLDAIDVDSTGYLIDSALTLAAGISLNKTADILTLESTGNTDTLTAKVTPDNATNKAVKWTSSDSSIVTVDENGNIKAVKAGTATITATTTDGSNLSKSCIVTVNEPTNITLDKTTDSINVGDTDKITASVTPAGQDVTWTSSDEGIAKVDQNGNVTGLKAGTAVITVATANGKTVSCTVTVKDQELGKSKLIIYMGNQVTREYYLTEDEIDNFINWYDARANDQTPKSYYVFKVPAQGVLPARKDYVLFNKIKAFEVE